MATLRALRQANNFSLRQLADKSHISINTIYLLEKGMQEPTNRTMKHLARALKVKMNELEFTRYLEEAVAAENDVPVSEPTPQPTEEVPEPTPQPIEETPQPTPQLIINEVQEPEPVKEITKTQDERDWDELIEVGVIATLKINRLYDITVAGLQDMSNFERKAENA